MRQKTAILQGSVKLCVSTCLYQPAGCVCASALKPICVTIIQFTTNWVKRPAREGSMLASLKVCMCVCAFTSVVPVRHDRRRELKAVGAKRPSHIWVCVPVWVWVHLCVCKEWPSLQTSVTDGWFWYQAFGFMEAYGQGILPLWERECKCVTVHAGVCLCVRANTIRTSSSFTKPPTHGFPLLSLSLHLQYFKKRD